MPSKRSKLQPILIGWLAKIEKCRDVKFEGDIPVEDLFESFGNEIEEDISILSFIRLMSIYMQSSNIVKMKTKRLKNEKKHPGFITLIATGQSKLIYLHQHKHQPKTQPSLQIIQGILHQHKHQLKTQP